MKLIFRWFLRIAGWSLIEKPLPTVNVNKAIGIFAPHTSNWDFVTMIMANFAWGLKVRFLGKHSLFAWPFGWFFRALGGMPVVRHESHNIVDQVVDLIESNDKILLALSPEGTRSYTPYWKTGFYHIAERSGLPIVMFYLDNKTRTIGFSDLFYVTGNIDADMKKIGDYFSDKIGYYPEKTSLVQTKKQYKLSERENANKND